MMSYCLLKYSLCIICIYTNIDNKLQFELILRVIVSFLVLKPYIVFVQLKVLFQYACNNETNYMSNINKSLFYSNDFLSHQEQLLSYRICQHIYISVDLNGWIGQFVFQLARLCTIFLLFFINKWKICFKDLWKQNDSSLPSSNKCDKFDCWFDKDPYDRMKMSRWTRMKWSMYDLIHQHKI